MNYVLFINNAERLFVLLMTEPNRGFSSGGVLNDRGTYKKRRYK